MGSKRIPELSRRAFAAAMGGSVAALGVGDARATGFSSQGSGKAYIIDAALRGLARAHDRGDPVLSARADAAIAELERVDPPSAALVQVYRTYDTFAGDSGYGGHSEVAADLAALHAAITDCLSVSFRYTDQLGEVTRRTVLPLALVHPPKGIKLIAWCKKRRDFRQFFIRNLDNLKVQQDSFTDLRSGLLVSLAAALT